MFVLNSETGFDEDCSVVSIAQFPQTEEIIGEAGGDVAKVCTHHWFTG